MSIHATFTNAAHRELILFGDMQIEKHSTIRVTLIGFNERKKHFVHRNENEFSSNALRAVDNTAVVATLFQ